MIQLTRNGMTGSAEIDALREEFEQLQTFRLPGLIHPNLLKVLLERLDQTAWKARTHDKIASEIMPEDPLPINILNFAANSPGFLEVIRQITGYKEINGYGGRVYRRATSEHYDSWHDDLSADSRLVGMSVNLSAVPYQGGIFRLRKKGTEEILRELPNTGPGDAIFFRISPDLLHMVTPVEGLAPKTAFAGWFGVSTSGFYSLVQRPAQ
jgi:hypothetical protein